MQYQIHQFLQDLRARVNAQNLDLCSNRYGQRLNSSCAVLSAGEIGLYVTVWLLTKDVCMLRLRKISRPDFKHSIISSFSSPLWKYPSPSYVYFETETFSSYASFLKPSQNPSSFNLFFKVNLCLTKTSFENVAHGLLWLLIKNIGYNIGTCF